MSGWWKLIGMALFWGVVVGLGLAARHGCIRRWPGGSGPNPWYG